MKKIINGKTYNTETAKLLGDWCTAGIGRGDFRYIEEELYISKKGQYFLYGMGGALTRYAKSCGNNSTCGSSTIMLFDEAEAREWCERYLDADDYNKIFEEIEG